MSQLNGPELGELYEVLLRNIDDTQLDKAVRVAPIDFKLTVFHPGGDYREKLLSYIEECNREQVLLKLNLAIVDRFPRPEITAWIETNWTRLSSTEAPPLPDRPSPRPFSNPPDPRPDEQTVGIDIELRQRLIQATTLRELEKLLDEVEAERTKRPSDTSLRALEREVRRALSRTATAISALQFNGEAVGRIRRVFLPLRDQVKSTIRFSRLKDDIDCDLTIDSWLDSTLEQLNSKHLLDELVTQVGEELPDNVAVKNLKAYLATPAARVSDDRTLEPGPDVPDNQHPAKVKPPRSKHAIWIARAWWLFLAIALIATTFVAKNVLFPDPPIVDNPISLQNFVDQLCDSPDSVRHTVIGTVHTRTVKWRGKVTDVEPGTPPILLIQSYGKSEPMNCTWTVRVHLRTVGDADNYNSYRGQFVEFLGKVDEFREFGSLSRMEVFNPVQINVISDAPDKDPGKK